MMMILQLFLQSWKKLKKKELKSRPGRNKNKRLKKKGFVLLNLTGPSQPQANFKAKRRWDDDIVFKNCAKGVDDQKKDKRFVNDTLRSEFHKKFMEKYIK